MMNARGYGYARYQGGSGGKYQGYQRKTQAEMMEAQRRKDAYKSELEERVFSAVQLGEPSLERLDVHWMMPFLWQAKKPMLMRMERVELRFTGRPGSAQAVTEALRRAAAVIGADNFYDALEAERKVYVGTNHSRVQGGGEKERVRKGKYTYWEFAYVKSFSDSVRDFDIKPLAQQLYSSLVWKAKSVIGRCAEDTQTALGLRRNPDWEQGFELAALLLGAFWMTVFANITDVQGSDTESRAAQLDLMAAAANRLVWLLTGGAEGADADIPLELNWVAHNTGSAVVNAALGQSCTNVTDRGYGILTARGVAPGHTAIGEYVSDLLRPGTDIAHRLLIICRSVIRARGWDRESAESMGLWLVTLFNSVAAVIGTRGFGPLSVARYCMANPEAFLLFYGVDIAQEAEAISVGAQGVERPVQGVPGAEPEYTRITSEAAPPEDIPFVADSQGYAAAEVSQPVRQTRGGMVRRVAEDVP